jgi:hypothetical protein
MVTARKFCELLAEEYEAHSEDATLDRIIEKQKAKGYVAAKYVSLLQKRYEKKIRSRQAGVHTPKQRAIDRCAYELVRRLLDRGWNPTQAATAVGRKMNLTRQAILGAYDRVAWPFTINRETQAFREKIVGPCPEWARARTNRD